MQAGLLDYRAHRGRIPRFMCIYWTSICRVGLCWLQGQNLWQVAREGSGGLLQVTVEQVMKSFHFQDRFLNQRQNSDSGSSSHSLQKHVYIFSPFSWPHVASGAMVPAHGCWLLLEEHFKTHLSFCQGTCRSYLANKSQLKLYLLQGSSPWPPQSRAASQYSKPGTGSLWLTGWIWSVFVMQVLLEHSYVHVFTYYLWLFSRYSGRRGQFW